MKLCDLQILKTGWPAMAMAAGYPVSDRVRGRSRLPETGYRYARRLITNHRQFLKM